VLREHACSLDPTQLLSDGRIADFRIPCRFRGMVMAIPIVIAIPGSSYDDSGVLNKCPGVR
jgi:hypothetical protein